MIFTTGGEIFYPEKSKCQPSMEQHVIFVNLIKERFSLIHMVKCLEENSGFVWSIWQNTPYCYLSACLSCYSHSPFSMVCLTLSPWGHTEGPCNLAWLPLKFCFRRDLCVLGASQGPFPHPVIASPQSRVCFHCGAAAGREGSQGGSAKSGGSGGSGFTHGRWGKGQCSRQLLVGWNSLKLEKWNFT